MPFFLPHNKNDTLNHTIHFFSCSHCFPSQKSWFQLQIPLFLNVFCFFRYFLITSSKYNQSWKGPIYFVATWNKSDYPCFKMFKRFWWCASLVRYWNERNGVCAILLKRIMGIFVKSDCFWFTKNSWAIGYPNTTVAFVFRVADLSCFSLTIISSCSGAWKSWGFCVIRSLSPTLTMTSKSQSYIHTVNNVETVNVIYLGWGEKVNTMLSLLNIFLILDLVPCGTESWKCVQCLLNCTLLYWYK